MKRILLIIAILLLAVTAIAPVAALFSPRLAELVNYQTLAALNLLGWSLVLAGVYWRFELGQLILRTFRALGMSAPDGGVEENLAELLRATERKNRAITSELFEKGIGSKQELSSALESLIVRAMKLIRVESAELALFDHERGTYHTSFVVGKPFRSSAQAMLSGAVEQKPEEAEPDVIVQPISFAGSVLGTLRVRVKDGHLPSTVDREILALLALQSGLAIVNAQYTKQLLRMREVSDESVRAKTGFLANLSHEIRGPLGIMTNAVELVLDGLCGPVSEEQVETLRMVQTNGEHLLDLVNDVLDYAKIESGKISVTPDDMMVEEVLRDIMMVVRKQAESKAHDLKLRPIEEPMALRCDRRHLRQMLINLITNAVKYTPDKGSIEIWAERIPGNRVRISVKDSGIGIESSHRGKVFSAFERVENSYSLKQVGTGLGMPLTRRLAEMNAGQVDFDSEPGKGSHFWLILPASDVSSARMSVEERSRAEEVQGNRDVVLLIQRDEGERNIISRFLNHVGFVVLEAGDEATSLNIIRSESIRAIILDNDVIDDPEVSVLDAIRRTSQAASLPVLIISTRAFVFDVEKYLKSGIDRVVFKPVELRRLAMNIRELIDGSFTGEVIDKDELEMVKKDEEVKVIAREKLIGVDDIVH